MELTHGQPESQPCVNRADSYLWSLISLLVVDKSSDNVIFMSRCYCDIVRVTSYINSIDKTKHTYLNNKAQRYRNLNQHTHWEKIPLMISGEYVLREEVEKLDKDIPVRFVRSRQQGGNEIIYCEKLVSD